MQDAYIPLCIFIMSGITLRRYNLQSGNCKLINEEYILLMLLGVVLKNSCVFLYTIRNWV